MSFASRHTHALFKFAEGWSLYRSLHLGTRGPAGSEYRLVRESDGRSWGFDTQRDLKRWLEQAGYSVTWESSPDWEEFKS